MKKHKLFLVLILMGSMTLAGCGGSSPVVSTSTSGSSGGSSGDSSGGSSGGTTISGPVTLAGTVSSGGSTALPDGYIITATDVATGKTTKATITSGKYSLTLDTTKTYVFVILDNNSREVAVVTGGSDQVQTILGEKFVVSGFKMAASESSGNITVNSTDGSAFWGGSLKSSLSLIPVDKYIARAGSSGTALASGGSSGNFGSGSSTQVTSSTKALEGDQDADGFPDKFDTDANGNGTADSQESSRLTNKPLGTTNIETVSAFAASYEDGSSSVVLRMFPKSTVVSNIKSVRVVPTESPSYVTSAIALASKEDVSDSSFPSAGIGTGTTWKSLEYALYKRSQLDTKDSWAITIQSSSTARKGDVFTIEVTYNDGTTAAERIIAVTDFVVTQSAALSAINTKSVASHTGSGASGDPYVLDGDALTFAWTRPTDKDGNKAYGMRYKISVTYTYSGGSATLEYPQSGGKFSPALDTGSASDPVSSQITLDTKVLVGPEMKDVGKVKKVSITPEDLLSTGRNIPDFYISTPTTGSGSSSSGGLPTGLLAIKDDSATGTDLKGSGTEAVPFIVTSNSNKVYLEWNRYETESDYTVAGIFVNGTQEKRSRFTPSNSSASGTTASGTVTFIKTFDGGTLQRFDIFVKDHPNDKSVIKNVYISLP